MYSLVKPASPDNIALAAEYLKEGKIVAFPTETVYGIATLAGNNAAVSRIYAVKFRSGEVPLQVICEDLLQAEKIGEFDLRARKIAEKLWPGPLTIVVKSKNSPLISDIISAGRGTVGLRVPDHPVAFNLVKASGGPIAASSANISGKKSPITAREVADSLGQKVSLILDGGRCSVGVSSTVIDLSERFDVLREGVIKRRQIEEILAD